MAFRCRDGWCPTTRGPTQSIRLIIQQAQPATFIIIIIQTNHASSSSLTMEYRTKRAHWNHRARQLAAAPTAQLDPISCNACNAAAPARYPHHRTSKYKYTYAYRNGVRTRTKSTKRKNGKELKMRYFLMMYFYNLQKLPKCNRHETHHTAHQMQHPRRAFWPF